MQIFAYVVLVAFMVDGYFKYRNYRAATAAAEDDEGGEGAQQQATENK